MHSRRAVLIGGAASVVVFSAATLSQSSTVLAVVSGGSSPAAKGGPKSPATPAAATPPHKKLVVHEDGIVIPTLVPGGSGLITVPVSNPDAGDIALGSITGETNADLAVICRDDIFFGTVVEGGTVLRKKGSRATAVNFHIPISFTNDPDAPQDCQADSYTVTFTATGSGK
ncbi:MAG: hypothetical protein JWQ59_1440 [Cryobacterium sp.]|nr:hypothetical protein [Cryobacterium sp.]